MKRVECSHLLRLSTASMSQATAGIVYKSLCVGYAKRLKALSAKDAKSSIGKGCKTCKINLFPPNMMKQIQQSTIGN